MSADDRYTYPGSGGVLRNKRGFTDSRRLDKAMNDLASVAWIILSKEPEPAKFDFAYLQCVHAQMFSRLFDWAGHVRDVDTVAGSTGIVYARPAFIEQNLRDMFRALAEDESLMSTGDPDEFVTKLSGHWGYLSLIHPFRDGNTRSQSLFISNLSRAAGHPLDWRLVDVESLRTARLRAMRGDERPLAAILRHALAVAGEAHADTTPQFHVDISNSSGAAATAGVGRCGKPRANGQSTCRRRVGNDGCPYHP